MSGFHQEGRIKSLAGCLHGIYTVILMADFILGPIVAAATNQPPWGRRLVSFAAVCGLGDWCLLSAACDLV